MNENENANENVNETKTKPKKSETESGPETGTGSPTTQPCANIVSDGTTTIPHALSLLFSSGSVVELRALGDGGVKSGYFTDFEMLADRARTLDAFSDVKGVYVTLNAVDPALLSRRANRVNRANRLKHRLSRTDVTTADADTIRRPAGVDPVCRTDRFLRHAQPVQSGHSL